MGCTGLKAAKITLIVINVLNIIGAIILIVAAAAFGAQAQPPPDDKTTYNIVVGFIIFISVCQIILSSIGIWGAAKEHVCMLHTYIGIVAVCFIILVVLFFVGLANSSNNGSVLAGLCLAIYVVREVKKNNSSGRVLA